MTFSDTLNKQWGGIASMSQLQPTWNCNKIEQKIGGILGKESYNPLWWKWAGKILKKDPAIILEDRGSIVLAVRRNVHRRKLEAGTSPDSVALRRRNAVKQWNNHIREYWDGKTIAYPNSYSGQKSTSRLWRNRDTQIVEEWSGDKGRTVNRISKI